MVQALPTRPSHSHARWQRTTYHPTQESTSGISPELVASVMPTQILHEDEVVLILTKPSLWFIVLTSFRFVVVTVLLGVLAVKLSYSFSVVGGVGVQTLAGLAVLIALGRLVWALLVWSSHIYMLTNQRLVTIKGVINVTMFQANLRKIQRTVLYKPLVFRFFGIGTIGIATAATESFDSTWVMIAHPLETHEQIVAAINKVQGGNGGTGGNGREP